MIVRTNKDYCNPERKLTKFILKGEYKMAKIIIKGFDKNSDGNTIHWEGAELEIPAQECAMWFKHLPELTDQVKQIFGLTKESTMEIIKAEQENENTRSLNRQKEEEQRHKNRLEEMEVDQKFWKERYGKKEE